MKQAEIDALARLLDGDPADGEATAETRALASFAQALESSAAPMPRAEFKTDLRAQLVEAARTQAASPSLLTRIRDAFDHSTARIRYSTRMAAATGATAMALSSGGVALAAQRSLPSDPFYGVKLVLEDARLAFVSDAVERGNLLLTYAERRLTEAEATAATGDMDAAARALAEADESSRQAAANIIRAAQDRGDPALLDLLDEFSRGQRSRLEALLPLLSGDALLAAEDALVALSRIDQRVAVLSGPCESCESDPATAGRADGSQAAPTGGDFDLAVIPPADEPFAACPCVADPADAAPVADDATDAPARAKRKAGQQGGTATGGDTGTAPAPGDDGGGGDTGGGDDGGSTTLPPPPKTGNETIDDAVDDAVDAVEDTVDDVLDPLPVKPPKVPVPSPTLDPGDLLP